MKKEDVARAIKVRPIGKVEVKKMEGPYEVSVDLPTGKRLPKGPDTARRIAQRSAKGAMASPEALLKSIKVKV